MSGAFRSFRQGGEMGGPHLPSLETLALAIEAHGSHAPGHLLRVRHYAMELAVRLGLDQANLEALELAATLQGVGELAVPQAILSKSGGLTPLEFEKMKTHAPVGELIVEQAGLPCLAARMVRGHHERWDGSGYPDGLYQWATPLGARILAVADCLSRAAPGTALQALRAGSGNAFDPRIAQAAVESLAAMERTLQASGSPALPDVCEAIAAAHREDRLLCQLSGELGSSRSLSDTLSAFDSRLRELISYQCIAAYRVQENRLSPAYVNGEGAQRFCAREIPCGEGPSGMAAATRRPVLNGNPGADSAHGQAPGDGSMLRSTLAIPLEAGGEAIAVVALHHAAPDAFDREDLRILLATGGKLAPAVDHALRQERADQLTVVDTLTGLPNRRALFQRLDAELARCRRSHATLALLVCEIDGLPPLHRPPFAEAQRLYKGIAAELRRLCREDDCVARMGEGFVLALGGFSAHDLPEKQRLIEGMLAELAPPDSGARPLLPKLGAAYYPDDGAYAEDLLACADMRLSGVCQG